MKPSLHDVERKIEKEKKLEIHDVDEWMLSDSDNDDHQSTYFCSDFKETPFLDDQQTLLGLKSRSRRAEVAKKETADVPRITLNPHKNINHFGDPLELNQPKGAMN